MIVFVGGFCVLNVNYDGLFYGVFISCFGIFINDFFVNLFDMSIVWKLVGFDDVFEGIDCKIGVKKWIVICVDLVFGLQVEFCVLVEVYVSVDGVEKFVNDFVVVWIKVMNFDWFDLQDFRFLVMIIS